MLKPIVCTGSSDINISIKFTYYPQRREIKQESRYLFSSIYNDLLFSRIQRHGYEIIGNIFNPCQNPNRQILNDNRNLLNSIWNNSCDLPISMTYLSSTPPIRFAVHQVTATTTNKDVV